VNKKVVIIGGGTGMSTLLKGVKNFPIDISAIVSVCDDGQSTGILRREFHTPAVGDIRKVIAALSETEPLFEDMLQYRFKSGVGLKGHTVGNILLTALSDITGSMSNGIEALSNVLKLKGKVIPLTEDNVTLMAEMDDGTIVEGEHNITESLKKIKKVYYKKNPEVNLEAIKAIKEADLIILSMGSIYTSIMPNLICEDIIKTIDKSKSKVMYICNMMTQPGETDGFKVSDHLKKIDEVLGHHKIDVAIVNDGKIDSKICKKYQTKEQKDIVICDKENLKNKEIIYDDLVVIDNEIIRHDSIKVAFLIFSYLLKL